MLIRAAESLRPLLADVVFVGGCVAELLVTDRAAPRIRETDDVDAIVQVATYSEYERLGARLEKLGFARDMSPNAPACRWLTPAHELGRIKVDIMPTAESRIGPTNPWYDVGMSTSESFPLTQDLTIRLLSAPAFLATKWAAFESRGRGDVVMSHDVEDIIAVVAGRDSLLTEIAAAPRELRAHLVSCMASFLDHEDADVAVEDALPDARLTPGIVTKTKSRLTAIARLEE